MAMNVEASDTSDRVGTQSPTTKLRSLTNALTDTAAIEAHISRLENLESVWFSLTLTEVLLIGSLHFG